MPDPRAVSIALQKGGVGKTTTAINLADRLAARDHDVLAVDLDQQGNLTEGIGLTDAYTAETHLGDALADDSPTTVGDIIEPTEWFDVLPAHADFDDLEEQMRSSTFGELWVRNEIVEALLGDAYDYIVIDSPPNLGPLSDASLIASQNIIIPLLMSEPSVAGFERMVDQQLRPLRQEIDIDVLAIVPNRLEGNNEERRIIEDLENSPFAEHLPPFGRSDKFEESPGPGIRERIALRRAWRDGQPLSAYEPKCDMLDRYDAVAEIVENGGHDA